MKVASKIHEERKEHTESFHLTNTDVEALNRGAVSFEAGRVKPWEEVKANLRAKLEDAKKNSHSNR